MTKSEIAQEESVFNTMVSTKQKVAQIHGMIYNPIYDELAYWRKLAERLIREYVKE